MIILGIILIAVGLLVPKLAVFFTIGLILLVIGIALLVLSSVGHPVGGRRHWY
jgi:membrane-bound ClpP family serine protease